MKNSIITFCIMLFSFAAFAQHEHHGATSASTVVAPSAAFKDASIGVVYTIYIKLKDALVASNANEAKKTSDELIKSLRKVKETDAAVTAATKIASTDNLSEQRVAFSMLSNEIGKLVKGGKLSSGAIYLEYCPMANKNEGAYWLSNEKEIKNPYFGSMMLKCGSVKETIH